MISCMEYILIILCLRTVLGLFHFVVLYNYVLFIGTPWYLMMHESDSVDAQKLSLISNCPTKIAYQLVYLGV